MTDDNYTLDELRDAELVPNMSGPNAYFVRFGEGDYRNINKTARSTLVLKKDVLDEDVIEVGDLTVDVDLVNGEYEIHRNGDRVRVPGEKEEHVLWSIYDEDAERLSNLFDELHVPTVRKGVMDWFMPRFRANDEVRKTEDGWVVNDDILVSWDGTNHPVDDIQTHVVRGGEAVEADMDKEARDVSFAGESIADTSVEATTPFGRNVTLAEHEARFLTTVALILDRNPETYDDGLYHVIDQSEIVGFTDTKSGLHHSHSLKKHDLRDLGVTDEAIDRLWTNSNDHTAVWEMAYREQEFRNAPFDVFDEYPNDSENRWKKIRTTREMAPIPSKTRKMLEGMYE